MDEASTGRSRIVAARALAHPAQRGFVGGLRRRDLPRRRHPSSAAPIFYRFRTFTLWIHGYLQASLNYFVAKFNKKIGKKIETVSKDTLNTLQDYHWPGNVRELESIIERAVITSQGTALQVLDRFENSRKAGEQEARDDRKALGEREHDYILQVLQKTGWRIEGETGAAIILGLNPSTLRGKMRKYGIRR
ncbi:MAG: hypothetical protein IMZ71_04530 [Chloroflexi bacterium]|nr:hypothetical protein [Chloroflexota bacterium]